MQGEGDHVSDRARGGLHESEVRDWYERARVLASVAAAHNKTMHALNGNTEPAAVSNTGNDLCSNELDLKKLFWEFDHGPEKCSDPSPEYLMHTWESEMAFHGFSAKDNWGLKVNDVNGKLHQVLELAPLNETLTKREPEDVLPNGRVFAGSEFAKWRLRVKDITCRLPYGYTLEDFVSQMEPDEADCYVLNNNVPGSNSAIVEDFDKGSIDFGKILGLYWIGVGSERNWKVSSTVTLAEAHKENLSDDDLRSYYYSSAGNKYNVDVSFAKSTLYHDWRVLGVKVALYNLLREDFFCDPTGRQNVIAERRPQKTERFNLRLRSELQFRAVAISFYDLNRIFEKRWKLMVDCEEWDLFGSDVALILLRNPSDQLGSSLWTLSHLEYPLAEVVDSYAIRWSLDETREGFFVRTAGLVDIASGSPRRIVFCVCDKRSDASQLNIFGMSIEGITSNTTKSWDAGPLLDKMIWCVLRAKLDLRVVFNEYATEWLPQNVFDWLEIDSLVNLLVVRWSRQPEAVVTEDNKGKRSLRLKRVSLEEEAIKHRGVPNGNCTRRLWDDFNDVNSVDATFSSREDARRKPFLVLKSWSNESEFCFFTKFVYCAEKQVDHKMIANRLKSGALGIVKRASYLRVAYEEWKREVGIGDEIVAPKMFKHLGTYYSCRKDSHGFKSLIRFVKTFLSSGTLCLNWDLNVDNNVEISLTGIRTGPMHRNLVSWRDWNQFHVKDLDMVYIVSTGWFVPKPGVRLIAQSNACQQEVTTTKWDHALACVDWVDQSENIGSKHLLSNDIHVPLPMRLFSSWQTELAVRAGWHVIDSGPIKPFLVGWGLASWKKDFIEGVVKATAVRLPVINVMKAWSWVQGLWKELDKGVGPYENYGDLA